jgi:VanZ family protein
VTDELHQILTPYRDASVGDVVADAIGGVIGAAVATGLAARYRRRRDAST